MMTLNMRPIGDRILVEPVAEKQNQANKSRIIIPDTAKEKSMECMVVALGSGKTDEDGKKVPFEMKKGDRVLMSKYGGTEIKLDGKEYKIVTSDDILAIID
jgi:chaperonin GroES